jgi:hypothetical protein
MSLMVTLEFLKLFKKKNYLLKCFCVHSFLVTSKNSY